jgi:hypothetical protein
MTHPSSKLLAPLCAAVLTALCMSPAARAQATVLPQLAHGSVWLVPLQTGPGDPAPGGNHGHAATFPPPAANADLTFATTVIDFRSPGAASPTFQIGGYLSSLGAVPLIGPGSPTYSGLPNAVTGVPVTPATPIWSEHTGGPAYATYMEISGDVYLNTGSSIFIDHDDGVSLRLNGVDVPSCSATVLTQCFTNNLATLPESYTWNGPSGLVNFDLVYSDGFGGPAYLQFAVQAVPEPGSYALMLGGLSCLVFLQRRRRQDRRVV